MTKKDGYSKNFGVRLYNHGFHKFGPMEQCTDGEWTRWDDVEPFLQAAERRVAEATKTTMETLESALYWKSQVSELRGAYYEEQERHKKTNLWRTVWFCVALATAIFGAIVGAIQAVYPYA